MRQGAHADAIDAGFGDGADIVQRDAAGGFQKQITMALVAPLNDLSKVIQRHIVEEDNVRENMPCPIKLLEILNLNLCYDGMLSSVSKGKCSGSRFRITQSGQVVVLDQNSIVKSHAMIVTAATAHGIFLQ